MKTWLTVCVLTLSAVLTPLYAQVRGRISGTVTSETGEPLPGANVSLEGTLLGASTDAQGHYVIVNVRPGVYTLKVQYIGYQTVRLRGVQVIADQTTVVNVKLRETAVNLGKEVVVTAERPLIQRDLTSKVVTMTADEIQAMPVNNVQEVLATQPGVAVLTGTPIAKAGYNAQGIEDFRLRGGRNNEVGLYIDGVKVSNPVYGGFGTHINNAAIAQLSIVSGGFSAKYGNALSGMINLTTKEAGPRPTGSVNYQSSRPFGWKRLSSGQSLVKNLQRGQFTFGSRLPVLPRASLFVSGEVKASAGTCYPFDDIVWDDYRRVDLGDTTIVLPTTQEIVDGYLRYGSLDSIQPGLSSNWRRVHGPDGRRINPLDQYRGWTPFGWDNSLNFFGKIVTHPSRSLKLVFSVLKDRRYRQGANYSLGSYRYFFEMQGQNVQIFNSDKETLALTHVLGPRMFYTLHVSRFYEDRKVRILRNYGRRYRSKWDIFQPDWANIKRPEEYVPYAGPEAVREPFESVFYLKADNRWYSGDNSVNLEARGDLTVAFGRNHELETGGQINLIRLSEESYQNISTLDPFPTIYQHRPIEGAAYAQLKLDFSSFILNAGIRLDYFNARSEFWKDPLNPLAPEQPNPDSLVYNEIVRTQPHLRVSPRVGLAYPLTDRAVLFFNFGHFYQSPNYRDLYRASGVNREMSLRLGNLIGNPRLQPELSVQYEIGWQQQILEDFALKVNLWAKETSNQVSSVRVPAYSDPAHINPFTYSVFLNQNIGSARGVDVELRKKLTGHFRGTVTYTYSRAKVLEPTSWDGYWSGATEKTRPKRETTAPWDQPHMIRALLTFFSRAGEGPALAGFHPLADLQVSVIYYGESGFPYTPYLEGNAVVERYSARWPFVHRFDVNVSRYFRIRGHRLRLHLQVRNLFDRKNVMTGYYRTGDPEDPGTSSYYTMSSTYWNSRNVMHYRLRRLLYWGIEYQF